jgi:hypothetical protein
MKKFLIILLIVLVILSIPLIIFFFTVRDTQPPLAEGPDPTIEYQKYLNDKTVTMIYRGLFPCPDCDGIENILSLSSIEGEEDGGEFTLTVAKFGTSIEPTSVSGIWSREILSTGSGQLVILSFENGEEERYEMLFDGNLVKVDEEGNRLRDGEQDLILELL